MKEQDKIPRKTTKWSGDRQTSKKTNKQTKKKIQNNYSEHDPGSQKKNGGKDWEDARKS